MHDLRQRGLILATQRGYDAKPRTWARHLGGPC